MKIRKWCNRLLTLGLLTALISSTITGTVAVFQERSGCIRFDGVNDWVDAGNDASLDITAAITVEARVKPNIITVPQSIVSKMNTPHKHSYGLSIRDSRFLWKMRNNDFNQLFSSSLAQVGVWQYVAGTFEGGTSRIYINEVLDTSATGFSLGSSPHPVRIGTLDHVRWRFNGLIDEVRIYNRALDSLEIQHNAIHRMPYNTTGLVLWLKMNECVGDTAFDSSVHGNHGVLVNNPIWESPFEAIIQ